MAYQPISTTGSTTTKKHQTESDMPSESLQTVQSASLEIDHWGERQTGWPTCNRWQAATGEWCLLAPDDIVALRELKAVRLRAEEKS